MLVDDSNLVREVGDVNSSLLILHVCISSLLSVIFIKKTVLQGIFVSLLFQELLNQLLPNILQIFQLGEVIA